MTARRIPDSSEGCAGPRGAVHRACTPPLALQQPGRAGPGAARVRGEAMHRPALPPGPCAIPGALPCIGSGKALPLGCPPGGALPRIIAPPTDGTHPAWPPPRGPAPPSWLPESWQPAPWRRRSPHRPAARMRWRWPHSSGLGFIPPGLLAHTPAFVAPSGLSAAPWCVQSVFHTARPPAELAVSASPGNPLGPSWHCPQK